jgi:nucleotide-binding universal stress UspA family protein
VVDQGDPVERGVAHAATVRAPLLVAGARGRAGLERMVIPSVGRELAALATVPVAVVPA